jgi:hypothetical protein
MKVLVYVGGGSGTVEVEVPGTGGGGVTSVSGVSPITSSGGDTPVISYEIAGQTEGDIAYFDGVEWTRLPAGAPGQVLKTQGIGGPPQWSSAGSGVQVLTQDIPLATLQAAGEVGTALFNIGSALPAGAVVFPSTAQIWVKTPFNSLSALKGALAIILGGYYPGMQSYKTPSNAADCTDALGFQFYGGGANSDADVGGLNASQGGQQLVCRVALIGIDFSQLSAGELICSIAYFVP